MASVFVLQHSYEVNEYEETKLIGVYSTREKAEETMRQYKTLPGFRNYPDDCFCIDEYQIDKNHWEEGFVSWSDAVE